jgi:protein-ribulosamine 3-kinase
LQEIFDHCGLTITRYEPVHGGDINHSFCLHTGDAKYFLKVNDAALYPGMFEKEAGGLTALQELTTFESAAGLPTFQKLSTLTVPGVIKHGITRRQQYLLLEWLEPGKPKPDCWENFGAAVAAMHRQPQSYFGWTEDNYIGSLPQNNDKHQSWHSFYTVCRIMPLVKSLHDSGAFNQQDVSKAESFCKKIDLLFPEEPPALLHGDLWSGNFMITTRGGAAIYDPAVYYGHREMDIGMTDLFGGFDNRFYQAYNEVYPLEKGWLHRLPLTQLYPLLVHAVLFGGHYVSQAREIIGRFG